MTHTTKLAENHKRIWLQPRCCVDERCWCEDPQSCDDCGMEAVKYVRADLADAKIERLRAALREARQAINDYGLDDFEDTTHETLAKIDAALKDEQSQKQEPTR